MAEQVHPFRFITSSSYASYPSDAPKVEQDVTSVLDAASDPSLCYLLYWQQLNDHHLELPIPDILCCHWNA